MSTPVASTSANHIINGKYSDHTRIRPQGPSLNPSNGRDFGAVSNLHSRCGHYAGLRVEVLQASPLSGPSCVNLQGSNSVPPDLVPSRRHHRAVHGGRGTVALDTVVPRSRAERVSD